MTFYTRFSTVLTDSAQVIRLQVPCFYVAWFLCFWFFHKTKNQMMLFYFTPFSCLRWNSNVTEYKYLAPFAFVMLRICSITVFVLMRFYCIAITGICQSMSGMITLLLLMWFSTWYHSICDLHITDFQITQMGQYPMWFSHCHCLLVEKHVIIFGARLEIWF